MNDETLNALDQWVQNVDKCIRQQGELIQKMSGHIIDHEVAINALERRIDHFEKSLSVTAIEEILKDFTLRPTTPARGSDNDDNLN